MTEYRKELREFYLKEVPQGLNQHRKDVGRVIFKDIPREVGTTVSSIKEGFRETGQDYKRFLTDKELRRSNLRDVGNELRNVFRRENRTDNSYNTGGRINMNSSFRPRQAPMQRQAERLADQGRYGDSMMVHMNPTEVQVLNQMAPGGLTRNPQTGQPEAFAFLAPLIASLAAKASAAGATGLIGGLGKVASLGGALSPTAAGALASGVTTTAATGSLEEGIKSGLMSGLIGKVGGDLIKGLGDGASGATQQIADTSGAAGGVSNVAQMSPVAAPPVDQVSSSVADLMGGAEQAQNLNLTSAPSPTISYGPDIVDASGVGVASSLPSDPVTSLRPDGGMFSGIGEAVGDIGIGDIAAPMLQGAVTSDAIAMYPGDGGDMQEEEKDDFYQEVRPGDRGIQMPEMGYDAGRSGEFDYFANPFQVIPVAKTGGHVKKFQTGGQTDEPIQLTGLRGFDQVTPPPSFDFSSSNIYGPAPVNQAETNLSTAGPANIASTTPVASPFAGIGMFNFGRGGRREFGPSDAEMFSYLVGRGGLPANISNTAGNVAEFTGTVETPDFTSRVPGRFPRASYEDLARQSMEDAAFDARMNASAPTSQNKEFFGINPSTSLEDQQMARDMAGEVFFGNTAASPNQQLAPPITPEFNVDSYMQDTMYSPAPTPTRIPGLGDIGMGQNFRFMS
tara:strand:- start:8154 stop:10184 length:2031 start_codon:yes stop_codon:yes gene_type:complete